MLSTLPRIRQALGGLLCLTLGVHGASAQRLPAPPDSVRSVLAAAPATGPGRISALLRIGEACLSENDPRTLAFAQAARAEARRRELPTAEGEALDLMGRYYFDTEGGAQALPLLLQARPQLAEARPADRVLNLSYLGQAYTALAQYSPARACYREAYGLAGRTPADSATQRTELLNLLGLMHLTAERVDSALFYLYRAVQRQHQLGQPAAEAAMLQNIAAAHATRRQFGQAITYARQALRLQASTPDSAGRAIIYHNLAAFLQECDCDSARQAVAYEREAIRLWRRYHNERDLMPAYHEMGHHYQSLGRPDSAEACYRRALALQEQLGAMASITRGRTLVSLAQLLAQQPQRLPEAQALAMHALALARRDQHDVGSRKALEVLRRLAAARHDYAQAYALYEQEQQLRDSLASRQSRALVERLRLSYETDKAEARVRDLEREQELAGLRRQRELLLLGGLVLALGAGLWAWYRHRLRRREQGLRTRLAADLHDDVGSLLTQLSLESSLLQAGAYPAAEQQQQLERLADTSRRAARQMSDVVWSIDARHDTLASVLDRMREHAYEVLPPAGLDIDFEAAPGLDALPLSLQARQNLYLIYKEALHNALKHGRGAQQLTVRLHAERGQLHLLVHNDGPASDAPIGRPGGNGLANIRMRAQAVGGSAHFDRPAEGGFRVSVQLPLSSGNWE